MFEDASMSMHVFPMLESVKDRAHVWKRVPYLCPREAKDVCCPESATLDGPLESWCLRWAYLTLGDTLVWVPMGPVAPAAR